MVEVDPRYFRPTEVDLLLGDATKAKKNLNWVPACTFEELVRDMVKADLNETMRDLHLLDGGFHIYKHRE